MGEGISSELLIKRLLGSRPGTTLEGLARELDVPLRTVQRWSTNSDPAKGPQWRYAAKLLAMGGWLNTDGEPPLKLAGTERPADELEELRANQTQMLADQQRVIENLESLTTAVEKLALGTAGQPKTQPRQRAQPARRDDQ